MWYMGKEGCKGFMHADVVLMLHLSEGCFMYDWCVCMYVSALHAGKAGSWGSFKSLRTVLNGVWARSGGSYDSSN